MTGRALTVFFGILFCCISLFMMVGSIVAIVFFGKDLKNAYEDDFSCIGNEEGVKMNLTPVGDTLRIDLAGMSQSRQVQMLSAGPTVYQLLEVGKEKDIRVYPEILVRRLPDSRVPDSLPQQDPYLYYKKSANAETGEYCSLSKNGIEISPVIYTQDHPKFPEYHYLVLYLPEGMPVEVNGWQNFEFDRNVYCRHLLHRIYFQWYFH